MSNGKILTPIRVKLVAKSIHGKGGTVTPVITVTPAITGQCAPAGLLNAPIDLETNMAVNGATGHIDANVEILSAQTGDYHVSGAIANTVDVTFSGEGRHVVGSQLNSTVEVESHIWALHSTSANSTNAIEIIPQMSGAHIPVVGVIASEIQVGNAGRADHLYGEINAPVIVSGALAGTTRAGMISSRVVVTGSLRASRGNTGTVDKEYIRVKSNGRAAIGASGTLPTSIVVAPALEARHDIAATITPTVEIKSSLIATHKATGSIASPITVTASAQGYGEVTGSIFHQPIEVSIDASGHSLHGEIAAAIEIDATMAGHDSGGGVINAPIEVIATLMGEQPPITGEISSAIEIDATMTGEQAQAGIASTLIDVTADIAGQHGASGVVVGHIVVNSTIPSTLAAKGEIDAPIAVVPSATGYMGIGVISAPISVRSHLFETDQALRVAEATVSAVLAPPLNNLLITEVVNYAVLGEPKATGGGAGQYQMILFT